jgi:hypothetical protein
MSGLATMLLTGCDDTMPGFANRKQIRQAAISCGLLNFEGNRVGANYDANVPHTIKNWGIIEDCIYASLDSQGLKATRFYLGDDPTPAEQRRRLKCGSKTRSDCKERD